MGSGIGAGSEAMGAAGMGIWVGFGVGKIHVQNLTERSGTGNAFPISQISGSFSLCDSQLFPNPFFFSPECFSLVLPSCGTKGAANSLNPGGLELDSCGMFHPGLFFHQLEFFMDLSSADPCWAGQTLTHSFLPRSSLEFSWDTFSPWSWEGEALGFNSQGLFSSLRIPGAGKGSESSSHHSPFL